MTTPAHYQGTHRPSRRSRRPWWRRLRRYRSNPALAVDFLILAAESTRGLWRAFCDLLAASLEDDPEPVPVLEREWYPRTVTPAPSGERAAPPRVCGGMRALLPDVTATDLPAIPA